MPSSNSVLGSICSSGRDGAKKISAIHGSGAGLPSM